MLGFSVAYDVFDRAGDLKMHYTDMGILDRTRVLEIAWNPYWNSIYMMTGTSYGIAILFFINFLAGVCLMIGYRTKLSCFLSWMFFLSVVGRNNYVGHSGDVYMRIMLLFANFLPLEKYYSLDDFFASKDPSESTGSRASQPKQVLSMATFAVIAQCVIMYVFSTYYKTGAAWTRDYTAAWMALQLDWFRLPLGDFFNNFPLFLRFLTWLTYEWERYGPLFLFSPFYYGPFRSIGAVGFMGMHLGFGMCLRLDTFYWITTAALTTLLPSWFWDTLFGFLKNPRNQISIHIYSNVTNLVRFVRLFAYFFLFSETEVTTKSRTSNLSVKYSSEDVRRILQSESSPNDSLNDQPSPLHSNVRFELMVLEKSGAAHFDLDGLILIFRSSPIFWPLAYLANSTKFGKWVVEKLYSFLIGGDRDEEEEDEDVSDDEQEETHQKPKRRHFPRRKRESLVSIVVSYAWFIGWNLFLLWIVMIIFQWNMLDAGFKGWRVSSEERAVVWTFGLDQSWRMFAPHPPMAVFYHVIEGELKNGEKVELFKNGALYTFEPNRSPDGTVSFEKPDPMAPCYKNHRGFKYWENGFNSYPQHDKVRLDLGRYLCREYNALHRGDERLVGHKVWIVWEHLKIESPDRVRAKPELLWSHVC